MDKISLAIDRIVEAALSRIPGALMAVALLIGGAWLIGMVMRVLRGRFERRNIDLSLRDFVLSIIKFILYTMLLLSVASMVGIQTTSFVAVLGAASLSIGLALQGSLSNFAGGVLILLFRPFRVGDYITAAAASGVVEKIDILYTTLRSPEGIAVFIPNGPLANGVISNFSSITRRRLEYNIGLRPDADVRQARDEILAVLKGDDRLLQTPAPDVFVAELTEAAVQLLVRAWAPKDVFREAYHDNLERIRTTLDTRLIRVTVQGNPFDAV